MSHSFKTCSQRNGPSHATIIRCILLAVVPLVSAGRVGSAAETDGPRVDWIWCQAERHPGVTAFFRRAFQVEQPVAAARLRVIGESASVQVFIDGRLCIEADPYSPLIDRDATSDISRGTHVLAVRAASCPGPAAFFLRLDVTLSDGSRESVVTDTTWQTSLEAQEDGKLAAPVAGDWQPAVSFGEVDERLLIDELRRVEITATDNYEQWKEALGEQPGTDSAQFWLAPDFELRMVRPAERDEDSWVSLAFDPNGRVVIAQEQQGLLRMTLSPDGSQVAHTERINDSLRECRGLLFAAGDLFAQANNSKALYRLRGDGRDGFAEPELLYRSSGGVGHGRNDVCLGPDGWIYAIHGDDVDLPVGCKDYTSPFREARRGTKTREGNLLRINPADGTVQLLASGLRNPFGIDFHPDGEMFTYDADAEYDMGAPWYRPTRVNHLVVGGDYGWRGVTGSWPPYYPDHPDNAPPGVDIGKGSPTAVKFGTGSNFPFRYRQALFVLDWAYGRVIAVHVTPRGSSYLLTAETFLKGRPLNVTDLDFAPDGSMYLVTGGRGTSSALYRVRYVGPPPSENAGSFAKQTGQQQERIDFAASSRQLRHRLEAMLLRDSTASTLDVVWPLLGQCDPWIRHAARNVLERIPTERWRQQALRESDRSIAANALLALARGGSHRRTTLTRLNQFDWRKAGRESRLAALYGNWLCLKDNGDNQNTDDTDASDLAAAASRLDAYYPARSFPENRLLSEMLIRLQPADAIDKTMRLLVDAREQAERLHYLLVLRDAKGRWTRQQRVAYFRELAQMQHNLGGAGMPSFVSTIREEAIAALADDERSALATLIESTASASAADGPAADLPARALVRRWDVDSLSESLGELDEPRDLPRGRAMFAAAACIQCHRIAGSGTPVGPELSSVRSRFSRRDLLEAIVDPSKVVPESYRGLQVVTRDGKTLFGQVVMGGDYRSPVLRLRVDPFDPRQVVEIAKQDIESQRYSATSWMPTGLLDTLTRDEILDLLAFIEAGGDVGGR